MTSCVLKNNSGLLTAKDAKEQGISKHQFYKLVSDNKLKKISRGIYLLHDEWLDELYLIHKRCPGAVFSHDEAFYFHKLIDREPLLHSITVYSGFNAHRLKTSSNIKAYSVKRELLEVGKIEITDNLGNNIPTYNLERTLCDAIRSRNSIEIQDFNSILKSYVRLANKNLNLLMKYAKLFRVDNVTRRYLEVLL